MSNGLLCQNPFKDQDAIFRTEDGYVLNLEKAEALLDSELFYLVSEKDSVGNPVYTFKRYASKSVKKLADSLFIENSFGEKFPDFEFIGIDKKTKKSSQLAGKIAVYNFWHTGCKPCLEEIPLLNKLVAEYKENVIFVAPTFEGFKVVNDFLKKYPFEYDILPNSKELSDRLKIASYPTHVITDDSGVIRKSTTVDQTS